jgi:hypothetical protein
MVPYHYKWNELARCTVSVMAYNTVQGTNLHSMIHLNSGVPVGASLSCGSLPSLAAGLFFPPGGVGRLIQCYPVPVLLFFLYKFTSRVASTGQVRATSTLLIFDNGNS